jgi:hypothetical protein
MAEPGYIERDARFVSLVEAAGAPPLSIERPGPWFDGDFPILGD